MEPSSQPSARPQCGEFRTIRIQQNQRQQVHYTSSTLSSSSSSSSSISASLTSSSSAASNAAMSRARNECSIINDRVATTLEEQVQQQQRHQQHQHQQCMAQFSSSARASRVRAATSSSTPPSIRSGPAMLLGHIPTGHQRVKL